MKKYFNNQMTLDEVKTIYRENAKALHPDHGGSVEAMQELNEQFEIAFKVAAVKSHSHETVSHFYTQYGWEGVRYDINLSTTEIAKRIRDYVKYAHPTYRFSVTSKYFSMGSSIGVTLTEYPVEITNFEKYWDYAEKEFYKAWPFYIPSSGQYKHYNDMTLEERKEIVQQQVESVNNMTLNQFYLEDNKWMNEAVLNVLIDVRDFINSYRFDDSDSQIDYFHTNFYYDMYIGRSSDKPAKLVERTARIAPHKETKAKKIA